MTINQTTAEQFPSTPKRRDDAGNNMTASTNAAARSTVDSGTVLLAFNLLSTYVTLGRSHVYALIAAGAFPPPIKIGRSSRWIKSEVDSWIVEQAAARQSTQAGA